MDVYKGPGSWPADPTPANIIEHCNVRVPMIYVHINYRGIGDLRGAQKHYLSAMHEYFNLFLLFPNDHYYFQQYALVIVFVLASFPRFETHPYNYNCNST